jgi:hypothetical protein
MTLARINQRLRAWYHGKERPPNDDALLAPPDPVNRLSNGILSEIVGPKPEVAARISGRLLDNGVNCDFLKKDVRPNYYI